MPWRVEGASAGCSRADSKQPALLVDWIRRDIVLVTHAQRCRREKELRVPANTTRAQRANFKSPDWEVRDPRHPSPGVPQTFAVQPATSRCRYKARRAQPFDSMPAARPAGNEAYQLLRFAAPADRFSDWLLEAVPSLYGCTVLGRTANPCPTPACRGAQAGTCDMRSTPASTPTTRT